MCPRFGLQVGELPQRRSAKSMLKAIAPKLYGRVEFKISFLAQRSQFLRHCDYYGAAGSSAIIRFLCFSYILI